MEDKVKEAENLSTISVWCEEMIEFYFIENYDCFNIAEKFLSEEKIEEIANGIVNYIKKLDFENKIITKIIERNCKKIVKNTEKMCKLKENLDAYLKVKTNKHQKVNESDF